MIDLDEREQVKERITKSHAEILTLLAGTNLEIQVYPGTDWRIRDILGHIATWERESTKSLLAHLNGTDYFIPGIEDDENDFNEQAVIKQRKLSDQEIISEWKNSREDFISVLSDIPAERFPGDLLFPWGGERGSISQLVEFLVEHDEGHRDDILKAVQEPPNEIPPASSH